MNENSLQTEYGRGLVLGADVGGTKTAIGLYDVAAGELVSVARFSTPTEASPSALVARVSDTARALIAGAERDPAELRAAGFAVPGLVDAQGHVLQAGRLRGWRDVPLADLVRDRLGVMTTVEQDANAAALAERWRGVAAAMTDFVFLALGTGVGAGVVIDGKLHRGSHFAAGEVGDLCELSSAPGPAGVKLGDRINAKAIADDATQMVSEKLDACEAIAGAAADPRLEELADEVAELVSLAVIAIATVIDPEAIIFGGGTASAGPPLLDRVRAQVDQRLCATPHLIGSGLGEDAQLYGAIFGGLSLLEREPG